MLTTGNLRVSSSVAVLGIFLSGALADTVVTNRHHTDAYQIMGTAIPAADRTVVTWLSADRARIDLNNDTAIVMRLDKNMMYTIAVKAKTWSAFSLETVDSLVRGAMAQGEKGGSNEDAAAAAATMKAMMGASMRLEMVVTRTAEKKKIGAWNCAKYTIKQSMPMAKSDVEMWASPDVKADMGFYQKIKNSALVSFEGFGEAMKEMKKIEGFPVLTTSVTTVMGASVKSSEELVEVQSKEAPAGTYDVPKGFREVK